MLAMLAAPTIVEARPVAKPHFVRNIPTGETGWFSSPGLVDLNGDRRLEIVAPFYSTFVFSPKGRLLGKGTATSGRVYAPSVVADLDRDGEREIVVGGNEGTVAAYSLRGGRLQLEPGWPASTCSGGQCPETRGMAAADLDGDGRIEVVATTTNTSPTGSQVFVARDLAAIQPVVRRHLQRHGQPRLRRLRGERRDRQPRRRPAARDRCHLRQLMTFLSDGMNTGLPLYRRTKERRKSAAQLLRLPRHGTVHELRPRPRLPMRPAPVLERSMHGNVDYCEQRVPAPTPPPAGPPSLTRPRSPHERQDRQGRHAVPTPPPHPRTRHRPLRVPELRRTAPQGRLSDQRG